MRKEQADMITVIGATGHTGSVVAERLVAAGERVRVIGRSAERLKQFVDRGAEPRVGDASDARFLTQAFRGADAVYAMIPPDYAAPYVAHQRAVTDAIVAALTTTGVKKVVFLSSLGAEQPSGTGPIVGLHVAEEALREVSGTDLLLLRPGFFFENHLGTLALIKAQGINGGAVAPDVPLAMIAARDIGAAAAEALRRDGRLGVVVHELLGPREYTMTEATRILGAAIGKPDLAYVQFPYDGYAQALREARFSASSASLFVELAQAFNARQVRSLESRNARNTTATTLEAFARDVFAPAYGALDTKAG